jgi:hypothetical protein
MALAKRSLGYRKEWAKELQNIVVLVCNSFGDSFQKGDGRVSSPVISEASQQGRSRKR